jgi:O-antigen ligase
MTNRLASALIQIGLFAVVLAVLPFKLFELDRYFVPKELVLHAVAFGALVFLLVRSRVVTIDLADKLLALFVVWSIVASLFASNYWLAQRALAVTVSSAIVFWTARRIAETEPGAHRRLLLAAAIATVGAAAIALAQAYGIETDYFSLNRVPGGTFGNRNFVAHIAAMGLSSVIYATVSARTSRGAIVGSLSAAIVMATLVLTRSRAAWLAVAAAAVVSALPLLASRRYLVGVPIGKRLIQVGVTTTITVALALLLPNRLNWNSDSPYLDSARGMVDYQTGSGKGRIAQYLNSMKMAMANPVFGVGPGNWPVRYAKYAPPNDRSLADDGMTANPWPSSDWVAFVSERGMIAAAALFGVFTLLLLGAARNWSTLASADAVLARLVLIGTTSATLVVSAFDAALLLGAPALFVWTILGAASGAGRAARQVTFGRGTWLAMVTVALILAVTSVARSVAQTVAIELVANGGMRAGWIQGAAWDPGSYRINYRVAQLYANRGQCARSKPYARRAVSLFPHAPPAARLLRSCGG